MFVIYEILRGGIAAVPHHEWMASKRIISLKHCVVFWCKTKAHTSGGSPHDLMPFTSTLKQSGSARIHSPQILDRGSIPPPPPSYRTQSQHDAEIWTKAATCHRRNQADTVTPFRFVNINKKYFERILDPECSSTVWCCCNQGWLPQMSSNLRHAR